MKKLSAILCLLLICNSITTAQAKSEEKQAVLAVLALNIARFTSWSEEVFDKSSSTFNLCVIGDNIVQESFLRMEKKIINGKKLHILNRSRLRNLSQCQLLYINGLERKTLVHVLFDLKDQPVLTVGEGLAFIQAGGMVGLEKLNGRMQLNINLSIVKQSKLVMSSRILKLAKIFESLHPKSK
ncbi:MAG: YfiR family protein [Methylococcales bacterium]|nr:YfiR family protein [Methylococcales bacterium]